MQKLNTLMSALVLLLLTLQFFSNRSDDRSPDPAATAGMQTSNVGATDTNIAALTAEVATMRREMAALSARMRSKPEVDAAPVESASLPAPASVVSTNTFFDELIASGSVAKGDLLDIGRHLSQMDDSQKQIQMDKLAAAINSRQVVFGAGKE